MGSQTRALTGNIKNVNEVFLFTTSPLFLLNEGAMKLAGIYWAAEYGQASYSQSSSSAEAAAATSGKQGACLLKCSPSLWAFFSLLLSYMQEMHQLSTETVTSTGAHFADPPATPLCFPPAMWTTSVPSCVLLTKREEKPIISTLFIAHKGLAK